ncbi:MAG: tripartite tricarboxylate transporter TctB family protein [Lachnospirales bacterium]
MGADGVTQIVNFDTSHYFFVNKIIIFLCILGAIMIVQKVKSGNLKPSKKFFQENADLVKLGLSIILFPIYINVMKFLGGFYPNMGYGFLGASILFMLALSLVFIWERNEKFNKKKLISSVICSILTPCITWYIFSYTLGITLP